MDRKRLLYLEDRVRRNRSVPDIADIAQECIEELKTLLPGEAAEPVVELVDALPPSPAVADAPVATVTEVPSDGAETVPDAPKAKAKKAKGDA